MNRTPARKVQSMTEERPRENPQVIYYTRSVLNTNIQSFKTRQIYNFSEKT